MKYTVLLGLIICLILTSFQIVRKRVWWIRFSDFPHIQITVLTIASLGGSMFLWGFVSPIVLVIAFLALLAIGYQVVIIFPYTRFSKKQSKDVLKSEDTSTISILESNVFMENKHYGKLLSLVQQYDPDIFITLESNKRWEDALSPLESTYIYCVKYPLDNTYGMHLYSKLKIKSFNIDFLVEDDVPSIEADILLDNDKTIRFYIVHPKPPSPTENDTSTARDAEMIIIGKKAKECSLPVIVAGDLNDVAWSHTTRLFQRISGLLDPRIGRGFFNTYNAKYLFIRWPLDHAFHSRHFLVKQIKRLPSIGSDHFPMFIELSLAQQAGMESNESPELSDKEDLNESKEIICKARS